MKIIENALNCVNGGLVRLTVREMINHDRVLKYNPIIVLGY